MTISKRSMLSKAREYIQGFESFRGRVHAEADAKGNLRVVFKGGVFSTYGDGAKSKFRDGLDKVFESNGYRVIDQGDEILSVEPKGA